MNKLAVTAATMLISGLALISPVAADQYDVICEGQAKALSLKNEEFSKFIAACKRNYNNPAPKAGKATPSDKTIDKIIDSERRS
ncbi:hypothetical protein [Rhizobium laguerreae]|uniref:hypothetical protein n=1 Tax=Rhizobium laguerreae TaxID=1076926 RepID=UPI001C91FF72|nr:hypothetical protein [Rhizobium laguerreae]MBY3389179.1 hypothetical protein [Rhizobium laguerreae]MBY3402930.1 hypothetical protein [Rhizobium laguerreae]MBY3409869.1 hypothetical protein [Rhizobium laguerreae]